MQSKSINYYLKKLISEGHKWQYTDINNKSKKPKYFFSISQWFILFISIFVSILLPEGFNKDFIGYIIASLSIFIGLFLTLILMIYDKFQRIDFKTDKLSEKEITSLIQKKNFFKQFLSLTSYSVLISLICIVLLSLSLLGNFFNINILQYELGKLQMEDLKNAIILFIILFYRIIIIYFILDFFMLLLYALTSIFTFISLEFDKIKIRNNF